MSAIALGDTKIQAYAFGMSDVQVAVGFRRKAGNYLILETRCLIVLLNSLFHEIQGTAIFVDGHEYVAPLFQVSFLYYGEQIVVWPK